MKKVACLILVATLLSAVLGKSIIMANYYNVILFFPKEMGGNDEIRVIFDVRNVSSDTFKYLPAIVDVAYDSVYNNAYCYMEGAVTSYIMLLRWSGGRWCYSVLFDFPASQFSKYMYHSIILFGNYIYWTTDRYIMSGRLPGYEKRALLQPAWNRVYSMTLDKRTETIYVSAYDYTENALFACNLKFFTCNKLLTTDFTLNYIHFNSFADELYVASIQSQYLHVYRENDVGKGVLRLLSSAQDEIANLIVLDEKFTLYTNQKTISIGESMRLNLSSRKADAHLIDPYAMQYVFSFNKILDFEGYPYPYMNSNYHDLLYKNSLYLFYLYICGMDLVHNEYAFYPQMDLNNQFLQIETCQNFMFEESAAFKWPWLWIGCGSLLILVALVAVALCRAQICRSKFKSKFQAFNETTTKNEQINVKTESSGAIKGFDSLVVGNCNSSQELCFAVPSISDQVDTKDEFVSDAKEDRKETSHSSGIYIFKNSASSNPSLRRASLAPSLREAAASHCNNRVTFNDFEIKYHYSNKENSNGDGDSIKKVELLHFVADQLGNRNDRHSLISVSSLSSSSLSSDSVVLAKREESGRKSSHDFINMCHLPFMESASGNNCLSFAKAINFPSDTSISSEQDSNDAILRI